MAKPKLSKVVHIPLMDYDKHVQEVVKIPRHVIRRTSGNRNACYYDICILDSHMFRGNDSSKSFHNQFMSESIPQRLRPVFEFLDKTALHIIFNEKESMRSKNECIVRQGEKAWLEEYVKLIEHTDQVLAALGEDDRYYYEYMMSGLYESAVLSFFKIRDFHKNDMDKYFWHISW